MSKERGVGLLRVAKEDFCVLKSAAVKTQIMMGVGVRDVREPIYIGCRRKNPQQG